MKTRNTTQPHHREAFESKRHSHSVNLRSTEGEQYDTREVMLQALADHHGNRSAGVWAAIEREYKLIKGKK